MPSGQQLKNIIEGCVKTKRESQKELYKIYYGFSMSICMRYCQHKDEAVEIVNDGFLKIFKTINKFIPKYENFGTSLTGWIKKIMIFTAIDHYRKNFRQHSIIELDTAHFNVIDVHESIIDKMSYQEIIALVHLLSPAYRTVFNLYVIDGFKHQEISKKLNISIGTSKSNLAKARFNIQQLLKETNIKLYEQRKAI